MHSANTRNLIHPIGEAKLPHNRAGMSPTLWTRGLASLGLASPTEQLPNFKKASIGESGKSFEVGLGLASPGWTRKSLDSRVPVYSSTSQHMFDISRILNKKMQLF